MSSAAAREARDRLIQRLAGSRPDHGAARLGIAAGMLTEIDARVARLIPPVPRAAAVLIGLTEAADPGILLTIRAAAMRQHAGQISFPGGTIEDRDTGPEAAAIREAQEEIGLMPGQARVVGFLPDQLVLTGFQVTPVVALIAPEFVPRLDHSEVQEIFELPFVALMDLANHRDTMRRLGDIEVAVRDIQFGPHRIWGATAGMLLSLYELAQP